MNHKLHLGSIATLIVTVGSYAYAQPVVPADDNACPNPDNSCPQPQNQTAQATPQTGQDGNTTNVYVAPPPPPAQPTFASTPIHEPSQLAFSVGGGVDDFAKSGMRRNTDIGGGWNARLTIGTRSWLAGELSYIGSAQSARMTGENFSTPTLYGNGAQAAVRVNFGAHLPVQPFVYGGAAWRHYSVSQGDATDDLLEIPAGAGLAVYIEDLMIDVRGEYRFAVAENSSMPELVGFNSNNSTSQFDRWGATGNLGYMF